MFKAVNKDTNAKMRFKKGDTVVVIAGKDKGKQGKIKEVIIKHNSVVVDGVNMLTKHNKPSQKSPQGGRTVSEHPIHASNVMILDPKTNKPSRISVKVIKDKKVRIAKKSGAELN